MRAFQGTLPRHPSPARKPIAPRDHRRLGRAAGSLARGGALHGHRGSLPKLDERATSGSRSRCRLRRRSSLDQGGRARRARHPARLSGSGQRGDAGRPARRRHRPQRVPATSRSWRTCGRGAAGAFPPRTSSSATCRAKSTRCRACRPISPKSSGTASRRCREQKGEIVARGIRPGPRNPAGQGRSDRAHPVRDPQRDRRRRRFRIGGQTEATITLDRTRLARATGSTSATSAW